MSYTHIFFTGFFFCRKCGYFQQNINMTNEILKKNFRINNASKWWSVFTTRSNSIHYIFVPHC